MWRGVHWVLLNSAAVPPEDTGAVIAAVMVDEADVDDATVVTTCEFVLNSLV